MQGYIAGSLAHKIASEVWRLNELLDAIGNDWSDDHQEQQTT